MRGEYFVSSHGSASHEGSPPLARGVQEVYISRARWYRITPACAGSTFCCHRQSWQLKDHPRLRGEYDSMVAGMVTSLGSPPLARGVLLSVYLFQTRNRITPLRGEYHHTTFGEYSQPGSPACAGSTIACPSRYKNA